MQGGIGTLNCKLHWCPNFSTFTLRSLHQYQYFGLDEIHMYTITQCDDNIFLYKDD